jgi:uncharacterized protein YcfL
MQVWNKIFMVTLATFALEACRMRSENAETSSANSSGKMKLYATCSSETPGPVYRNIIVQEDTVARKGLLLMDSGESSQENQTIKAVSLAIETRESAEIRRTYSSGDLTLSIDLERNGSDTFTARLKDSVTKPEVTYNCAI